MAASDTTVNAAGPDVQPLAVERLALRPRDAAKALGIGERLLWSLTADRGPSGIPHVRLGKRVVYPVAELRAWLAERAKTGGKSERN